jgi:hypothetical protein
MIFYIKYIMLFLVIFVIVGLWIYFNKLPNNKHLRIIHILLIVISLSMIIHIYILHQYISNNIIFSGGQIKSSPNNTYVAYAQSKRQVLTSQPTYYEYGIKSSGGNNIKTIQIETGETFNPDYFRLLPEIIKWTDDSNTVEYVIP